MWPWSDKRYFAVRAYYHEKDLTPLVVGAVAPLVEDLHPLGVTGTLLFSHWSHGPHVDLVVHTTGKTFARQVWPLCKARLEAWLHANPSRAVIQRSDYLKSAKQLARQEGYRGWPRPLRPNNRVVRTRYKRPSVWGIPSLTGLRDRFLIQATPITLELAALKHRDPEAFMRRLVQLMTCLAQFTPKGLESGVHSYRAHGRAFVLTSEAIAEKFSRTEVRQRHLFAEGVAYAAALGRGDPLKPSGDALLDSWLALLRSTFADVEAEVATHITKLRKSIDRIPWHLIPKEDEDSARSAAMPDGVRAMLSAIGGVKNKEIFQSEWHNSYRILLNYFYLILPNLSVSSTYRFYICYAITKAIDEFNDQRSSSLRIESPQTPVAEAVQ